MGPKSNSVDRNITTSGDILQIKTAEMASIAAQIAGTWTGTISFEGTVDGSNWVALSLNNLATGASASSSTSNGVFNGSIAGFLAVRLRASAAITQTASVSLRTTVG